MEITAEAAWAEGISLSEARREYSDADLWQQFEVALATITRKLPPDDLPRPTSYAVIPPGPPSFDPIKPYREFSEIDEEIKNNVLNLLKSNELIAIGYQYPNLPGSLPKYIDQDYWQQGRVSWSESELWAASNDCLFEQIRVIPSPGLKLAAVLNSILAPSPQQGPGRPTRREDIINAYRSLRDAGKIDFASLRQNIPQIKQAVVRLFGGDNTKNLQRSAIEGAIREEFKRDRDRHVPGNPPGNRAGKQ